MLTLYYSPGACSFASHIALYDAGADFEARRVNFKATEQHSEAYLKINPKGRVPALVTRSGRADRNRRRSSPTSPTRIARRGSRRFPTHGRSRNCARSSSTCARRFTSRTPTNSAARAGRTRKVRSQTCARKVTQNMSDCFSLIERDMLRGPWVFGESYTIADPYLFTFESWLEGDGVDISEISARRRAFRAHEGARQRASGRWPRRPHERRSRPRS